MRRNQRTRNTHGVPVVAGTHGAEMVSKTFYDCGCMEHGDQFFRCEKHRSDAPSASPFPPSVQALIEQWRTRAKDADAHTQCDLEECANDFEAALHAISSSDGFTCARCGYLNVYAGAKRLIGPSSDPPEWKPISSAPNDGTWVLVFTPDGVWPIEVCCYYDHDGECGWNTDNHQQPTHWMPLPAPPSAEERR